MGGVIPGITLCSIYACRTGEDMQSLKQSRWWPEWKRLGIILVISTVFALFFNEVTYNMQRDPNDRAPRTVTLVVPPGTAQRIAEGQKVDLLPEDMVFVVGDVLAVQNNDLSPHQLGPVWVPPGSTGSLKLEQADRLSYQCSFESSRYLGLDVRSATTWSTRLAALLLTAPTLGVLLFLYSLAAYPIKPQPVR
jgi:hypothetical protein